MSQIARLAVKVPYAKAWHKEINLLFTESLSTFVMNDAKDVAAFATGETSLSSVMVRGGWRWVAAGGLPIA